MSNVVTIQTTASNWAKLMDAKARANAAKREAEEMEKALGLSDAATLAAQCGASEGKAFAVVVDGNGAPIGKLTLSYVPERVQTVSAHWRKVLS